MTKLTDSDPHKIGPFDVLERLGSGASGVVYKAADATGRIVALKVLRPEIADQPQVRQRLAREADALQKVEGSRTVRVIEVDAEGERPYLAMEFVPGESLEEFITQNGPMKGANLWGLVEALIEALQSLEKAGVVHRDLKPSNVLIGPDGIKIVDFGISSLGESSGLTETGVVLGTASWLSPEQISGGAIGSASDVFNLGLIITYAATGHHPFGEGRSDALMYRVAHSEPDLTGLSSSISQIVAACLQKNPAERPGLAALSNVISGMPSGDRDSDSSSDHLAAVIPQTRIVTPTLGSPAGSSTITSASSPNSVTEEPQKSSKKKLILAGATAALLVIVGSVVAIAASRGNDDAAYAAEFEKALSTMETLETLNEKYSTDSANLEKGFFDFNYAAKGLSYTEYVRVVVPGWWKTEYSKIHSTFYEVVNPKINELRTAVVPEIDRRNNLLEIRTALADHYDTWLEYAQLFDDALTDFATNDKSWSETENAFHKTLSTKISDTFGRACNLLGTYQPTKGDLLFTDRIQKECEN